MRWVLDSEGSVIYRSREWLDFTGLSKSDTRSTIRSKATHPEDFMLVEDIIQQALKNLSPFLVTFRLRHASDDYAWVIAGAMPTFSPIDGSFLGYLGETEEITSKSETSRVLNVLSGMQPSHGSKNPVLVLDTIAQHLIVSRNLAKENGDGKIIKILDFGLLIVGDELSKSMRHRS